MEKENVPSQLQYLINEMLAKKDIHYRTPFYHRLQDIYKMINGALEKFEKELKTPSKTMRKMK